MRLVALCVLLVLGVACQQNAPLPSTPSASVQPAASQGAKVGQSTPLSSSAAPGGTGSGPTVAAPPAASSLSAPPGTVATPPVPPGSVIPLGSPPPTLVPASVAPTNTPLPSTLDQALARQAVGDYTAAITMLRAMLASKPGPDEEKQARFRLAQTLQLNGESIAAILELAGFVQTYPTDPLTAPASFMLGRLLFAAQQWDGAVEAYSKYVSLGGPLTDYAQNRVGNAYYSAQQYAEAAHAYEAALRLPDVSAPVQRAAWHGLGDSRLALGDLDGARLAYETAFQKAADDEDRAAAVYALFLLKKKQGETVAAKQELSRLWTDYPGTLAAYQAVQANADEGDVKLQYGKGLTAYRRGDDRLAVEALNKSADQDPAHPSETHLYAGLAYRRLGQTRQAVFHYDQLIDTHPGDRLIPDALLGKARALRQSDAQAALSVYDSLVKGYPSHSDAGRAALEAAMLMEDSQSCAEAMPRYQAAADSYPTPAGLDARARLGLCQMRMGDHQAATTTWQALIGTAWPDRQAQGLYWLGHLASANDPQRADDLYRQAATLAPASFYGARSLVALDARPTPTAARDRASAEKWLLNKTGRTTEDLNQTEKMVSRDGDIQRAAAFMEQGMRDVALRHLRLARLRAGEDALRLYHVARLGHEMGGYGQSMTTAERLATVLDTPLATLPPYILGLAYPRPYAGVVAQASRQYAIDPALFYAIMRQESRFEPAAQSSADARGLAQVLPTTGQSIARSLNWPDYKTADLFKPYVNIEFGAFFLAQQMKRFEGEMWAALAAYNAGPNAVPRWRAAASDPALQIEAIDYPETATYVRRVTEFWAMYALLGE